MKQFFDTSVLVAAFRAGHQHHPLSVKLLATASKEHSACGMHTLAEVYAVMTALPVPPRIKAAERGLTTGRIYDALILRCAAKSNAAAIYTWNLKHFSSIAPEPSNRIRTPEDAAFS